MFEVDEVDLIMINESKIVVYTTLYTQHIQRGIFSLSAFGYMVLSKPG